MLRIKITLVQEITIIEPDNDDVTIEDVHSSLQDSLLDMQDCHQTTTDDKFTYETGPFTLIVEPR
jgi:hypothetical protein